MTDKRTLDELKEAGDGRPAPGRDCVPLPQAFEQFGARALWSRKPSQRPTGAGRVGEPAPRRQHDALTSRPRSCCCWRRIGTPKATWRARRRRTRTARASLIRPVRVYAL